MLNLSEMQVFTVAAETENFSKAARRLRLSQPAVSQQIRSLENYLDVELFLRSGRGVTLTEAGGALLPLARELLDLSRHIEETMRSHPLGREAAIIGQVVEEHPGTVILRSRVGGKRVVDMLSGEQLPRIC